MHTPSNSPQDNETRRLRLDFFGHSDLGRAREANEDNYLCIHLPRGPARRILLTVADGMGGHIGGEAASQIAVDSLREAALRDAWTEGAQPLSTGQVLQRGFTAANEAVLRYAEERRELKGMGTTLLTALVVENHVTLANVGDSRAYLLRDGALRQISEDHSWRAEQLAKGELSEKEIEASPFSGAITRCIGYEAALEVDLFALELAAGDRLLLCSDGLYGYVEKKEIRRILEGPEDAEALCHRFIDAANGNGGRDNITCVLALCSAGEEGEERKTRTSDTVPLDLRDMPWLEA